MASDPHGPHPDPALNTVRSSLTTAQRAEAAEAWAAYHAHDTPALTEYALRLTHRPGRRRA